MDFQIPWMAGNFFHTQLPKVFPPWIYICGIVSVACIYNTFHGSKILPHG